ncbi:MAG: ABC transporter substrate-binding protein [Proteobacteria bacterium]|nr:ABC transporter substrate-binding protein [Pseudomonadota bacterium]
MQGIVIGSSPGYDFGAEFGKAEKEGKIKVQRVPKDEQNLKKLMLGRIKLYPQDLVVGYDLIRRVLSPAEALQITYHSKALLEKPHHLLLSKKIKRNKHMMERFNSGLKRLKESGKLDRYFEESMRGEYIIKK